MTGETPRALPLDGITVLDLGRSIRGRTPGSAGESGARIIKVEAVSLNLKSPRGRELFLQLAAAADAVLCNFAPGVPERLGIDASTLWETNPRLVFAQASGYGLDGPDSQRTAMDLTVQAHMGSMSITGFPDQPPTATGARCSK